VLSRPDVHSVIDLGDFDKAVHGIIYGAGATVPLVETKAELTRLRVMYLSSHLGRLSPGKFGKAIVLGISTDLERDIVTYGGTVNQLFHIVDIKRESLSPSICTLHEVPTMHVPDSTFLCSFLQKMLNEIYIIPSCLLPQGDFLNDVPPEEVRVG